MSSCDGGTVVDMPMMDCETSLFGSGSRKRGLDSLEGTSFLNGKRKKEDSNAPMSQELRRAERPTSDKRTVSPTHATKPCIDPTMIQSGNMTPPGRSSPGLAESPISHPTCLPPIVTPSMTNKAITVALPHSTLFSPPRNNGDGKHGDEGSETETSLSDSSSVREESAVASVASKNASSVPTSLVKTVLRGLLFMLASAAAGIALGVLVVQLLEVSDGLQQALPRAFPIEGFWKEAGSPFPPTQNYVNTAEGGFLLLDAKHSVALKNQMRDEVARSKAAAGRAKSMIKGAKTLKKKEGKKPPMVTKTTAAGSKVRQFDSDDRIHESNSKQEDVSAAVEPASASAFGMPGQDDTSSATFSLLEQDGAENVVNPVNDVEDSMERNSVGPAEGTFEFSRMIEGEDHDDMVVPNDGYEEADQTLVQDEESHPGIDSDIQIDEVTSTELPAGVMRIIDTILSYSQRAIEEDPLSPQGRALIWLQKDVAVSPSLPLWRTLQRYALATLLFSLLVKDGDDRILGVGHGRHECEWFQRHAQDNRWFCNEADEIDNVAFAGLGLVGTIPDELQLLSSSLRILDFRENPGIVGSIPSTIGVLSNLKHLLLQGCGFQGSIPSELWRLSELEALGVSDNPLGFTLPTEIGLLRGMRDLQMQNVGLVGSLPTEMIELRSLTRLLLSNNELTGSVPAQFAMLRESWWLDLSSNHLSGSIPSFWWRMKNLEALLLGHNEFTGTVPPQLSYLKQLLTLSLHDNKLSGDVSKDLTKLTKLSALHLHNTGVDGPNVRSIANALPGLTDFRWLE